MITDNTNLKYIKSQDIRVFPCAYRGYYNTAAGENGTGTALVFDPEARATTEANFTDTFQKLSPQKRSYVVAWIPDVTGGALGTLKCVIGGYYFEIYNQSIQDFFYTPGVGEKQPYHLCIKTTSSDLGTSNSAENGDRERSTQILSSFKTNDNYLDILLNGEYYFTGLCLSPTADDSTDSLIPFIVGASYEEEDEPASDDNKAEQVGKYYLDSTTGTYIRIASNLEAAPNGSKLFTKIFSYEVDPNKLTINHLLDVGTGKAALRMLGEQDSSSSGSTTTEASGNYSIALGFSTTAKGDYSIAIGNDTDALGTSSIALGNQTTATATGAVALGNATVASERGALAVGNNTNALAEGSATFGNNTTANKENQFVIGQYNANDENQAFIIANGTAESNSNKFTVSYTGDVKALGNLEVNGNQNSKPAIASTGEAANDLVLGTAVENSYGSITVYGKKDTEVFTVDSDGNTNIEGTATIASTTEINGSTSINNSTSISGITKITNSTNSTLSDATLSGALQVTGGSTIGKNLKVNGKTQLNDNLSVANGKSTYLGGSLEVADNESTTLGGTLTVKQKATFKNDLDIIGNVTIAGNPPPKKEKEDDPDPSPVVNILTIGSAESGVSGALDIYGLEKNTKIFNVTNTGTTTIAGTTNITNSTDTDSINNGALTIAGGVGIAKKLRVGETAYIDGDTILSKDLKLTGNSATHHLIVGHNDTTMNTKSGGSLTIYTTAGNVGFNLGDDGKGTIYNGLEIGSPEAKVNSAVKLAVKGDTVLEGNVQAANINVSENISSVNLTAQSLSATKSLTIGTTATEDDFSYSLTSTAAYIQAPTITVKVTGEKGNISLKGNIAITDSVTIGSDTDEVKKELKVYGSISGVTTITASDKIQAKTFNATSDKRKKTNIEDYYCKKSILDLPIKSFEYIEDSTHSRYIGCLAQDLQEICPEIVSVDKDGFLSIQETKLVYLLLQEIKNLKAQIEKNF